MQLLKSLFVPANLKPLTSRLSEAEVRERISLCFDSAVIEEIYTFGQVMLKEAIDSTRALDIKAASMAAYGGAIVTLLVSTSESWLRLGNAWTLALGTAAAMCACGSSVFSVMAMALRDYEWLSQKEWLEKECITQQVVRLKAFRILTIWGAMDSHKSAQIGKVARLKQAQRWLAFSIFFVLLILLHIGWFQGFNLALRAAFWKIA